MHYPGIFFVFSKNEFPKITKITVPLNAKITKYCRILLTIKGKSAIFGNFGIRGKFIFRKNKKIVIWIIHLHQFWAQSDTWTIAATKVVHYPPSMRFLDSWFQPLGNLVRSDFFFVNERWSLFHKLNKRESWNNGSLISLFPRIQMGM